MIKWFRSDKKLKISKWFYDYGGELYNISRHFHINFDETDIFNIMGSDKHQWQLNLRISDRQVIVVAIEFSRDIKLTIHIDQFS